MITPRFSLSQNESCVFLVIECPFLRATGIDIHVHGSQFQLLGHPYFLKLSFPGPIEEGKDSAKLDISTGQLSITLIKNPAQHFPDLDLLTQFIEPSKTSKQVFQSLSKIHDLEPDTVDIPIDFEWDLPQELVKESLLGQGYGFNHQYSGYSKHVQDLTLEILEVNDLEHDSVKERRSFRHWVENEKFNEDHVLSDLLHQKEWSHVMDFKPKMHHYLKQIQKDRTLADSLLEFSEQEKQAMLQLKNRTYLLENPKAVYLGLVDLLFAYAYNHRTTEGENTVESGWTICKLSPTLVNMEVHDTLMECCIASIRRVLTFPLYRNYDLALKCLKDVVVILKLGKRACLKALLEIKFLLDRHEAAYVLCRLWLDDYCVWIQQARDETIQHLAHKLHHLSIQKADIGWPLEELEHVAQEAREEREE